LIGNQVQVPELELEDAYQTSNETRPSTVSTDELNRDDQFHSASSTTHRHPARKTGALHTEHVTSERKLNGTESYGLPSA